MPRKHPRQKVRPNVDRYGRTALHYAAAENDTVDAQELIAPRVDVHAKDDNEWTALHFAAQSNSFGVARLLIEAGADVDPADSFGNTPLSTAVFSYRGNGELIMLLCEKKADRYRENYHGQSPLALARLITNYDVAKYFDGLAKVTLSIALDVRNNQSWDDSRRTQFPLTSANLRPHLRRLSISFGQEIIWFDVGMLWDAK
jgi:uncharacterized protein